MVFRKALRITKIQEAVVSAPLDDPRRQGIDDLVEVRNVVVSVADKTGLEDFAPALVEAWYGAGRSALLPVACTGELVSSRHHAA